MNTRNPHMLSHSKEGTRIPEAVKSQTNSVSLSSGSVKTPQRQLFQREQKVGWLRQQCKRKLCD